MARQGHSFDMTGEDQAVVKICFEWRRNDKVTEKRYFDPHSEDKVKVPLSKISYDEAAAEHGGATPGQGGNEG